MELDFLVLHKLTDDLPQTFIDIKNWNIPTTFNLADTKFHIPATIDVLLGAEVFYQMSENRSYNLNINLPSLYKTVFGWIVGGTIKIDSNNNKLNIYSCTLNNELNNNKDSNLLSVLNNTLTSFWECEELYNNNIALSLLDKECEKSFEDSYKRNDQGRFVVKLLFKSNVNLEELSDTFQVAVNRFLSLEKRFKKDNVYHKMYVEFMNEYISLGHMKIDEQQNHSGYFIPHHGILKLQNVTTKFRVVFDASSRTENKLSLNECLHTGPKIQQDLFDILLRFRMHRYVFCADIRMMFRQINIDEDHFNYQKILWREHEHDVLKIFNLTTVTYGTTCAPYLAVKSLQKIAILEKDKYPHVTEIVLKDFYMDDVITGCNSVTELLKLKVELIELLSKAGFDLHKWHSNVKEINSSQETVHFQNENVKTLGVIWQPASDNFKFKLHLDELHAWTKRSVLSQIAKLFDPLGLIGPTIFIAKKLMQEIWKSEIKWDDNLPKCLDKIWKNFLIQISKCNDLDIPRCTLPTDGTYHIELHGFCDASEAGYGAVFYIKSTNQFNNIHVQLLCSKSRIAPLKHTSIPRLELCAALLLAQLYNKIKKGFHNFSFKTKLWTDSIIVYHWINAESYKFQTYVSNRISEIQSLCEISLWNHISSKNNPADYLSRGLYATDLINCDIWWNGPNFLCKDNLELNASDNVIRELNNDQLPELKRVKIMACITPNEEFSLFKRCNNYTKLIRVMAYCLRFVSRCRKHHLSTLHLNSEELCKAKFTIIKLVQKHCFHAEIKYLNGSRKSNNSMKSNLLSLSLFLDNYGIIRVGGRLQNSKLNYSVKHPILLPKNHIFTTAVIWHYHHLLLHSGPSAVLANIRQTYWLMSGRDSVRKQLYKCVTCFKSNPRVASQHMGNLPFERTTLVRPFYHTGVDFCGPFMIKPLIRSKTVLKTYVSIFVCFATKAIHIELVNDLTSDSFIAALKRFISRRGKPVIIFSDNGTNFIGAHRKLKQYNKDFTNQAIQLSIQDKCAQVEIDWKFNPPLAPHFGGLWEAAVKTVKHHINRLLKTVHPTQEELLTLLAEIEGTVNSRPITPLSSDPNDLIALTPAHFLIGDVIQSVTEPDLQSIRTNRLRRWQLISQMHQHFWKRWHLEYLNHLQQKGKWFKKEENLKLNQLVLLKDVNLPTRQWLLGRIVELFTGTDNLIRVVRVVTKLGIYKRPISKVCPLPIEDVEQD